MAMMLTIGDSNISNFTRESCEFSTGALGISQDKSQISWNLWRSPWRTMQKRLADVPLGNAVVMSVEISWNIAIDIHRPWTKSCLIWHTMARSYHSRSKKNISCPSLLRRQRPWMPEVQPQFRSGHVGKRWESHQIWSKLQRLPWFTMNSIEFSSFYILDHIRFIRMILLGKKWKNHTIFKSSHLLW